jgi:DNA-binding transcriptional LysR family regulator
MIRPAEFAEFTAFAAVAEARSFKRAAEALKLQPSTLSHSVRALEERLGIKLLARTTRSVAPTEAGAALLALIVPALSTLDSAGEAINPHRLKPRGTVRLTLPQGAAMAILAPKLGAFAEAYPDVTLDVSVDDGFTDIVSDSVDAGIRLGESVADGMTAIRVSADRSAAVVASPAYWTSRPPPETPRELSRHLCINRRYAVGRGIYRWRFVRGDEEVAIACEGPLIINSEVLMRRAALDGVGVAMLAEDEVADDISAGRLVRVLQDWCPPIYGFFLYHPSHRLPSASLTALIQTLRVE